MPRSGADGGTVTAKRLFDIGLAVLLLVPGLPAIALIWLLIALRDGRPAIYASPRVRAPGQIFTLWKFRTMTLEPGGREIGVSGGDKADRITPLGRFLRRSRLDELPQLFNVLRGDMSFVGPRPPAPMYVDRFPELYAKVLECRPGITGLATVMFHSHEEWLLKGTTTAEETDEVYVRRCVPRKARLDLLYRDRQSLGLDLYLIYLTAGKLLPLPGRRLKRLKSKAKRS
jgi:lipopolysaccharide/colanic/teichoic acid biosynthesis glycosyltransferase